METSDPVVRARLAGIAAPGPRTSGEVEEADPEVTSAGSGLRSRALASALTAYTAAHGHPLEHTAASAAGRRWATGPRVLVVARVALVLLAAGAVLVPRLSGQAPSILVPTAPPPVAAGEEVEQADAAARSGPATGTPAEGSDLAGPGGAVVVHVVGEVGTPGIVELPAGSRVGDAVEAAGGSTPGADLSALNLARTLVDGEQIRVPVPGEVPDPAVTSADPGGGTGAGGSVDLNTADEAALDDLPGIGPVLAERIVGWRTEHGGFTVVDELLEVSGIGPALLEKVRDQVHVG